MTQRLKRSNQNDAVALLLKEFAEAFSAPDPTLDKAAIDRLTSDPVIAGAIDNMMTDLKETACEAVEEALLETIDVWSGAVDPAKLDPVNARHFALCGDCQAFAADMSQLLDYPEAREAVSSAAQAYREERSSEVDATALSIWPAQVADTFKAGLRAVGDSVRERVSTVVRFPRSITPSFDLGMAAARGTEESASKPVRRTVDDPDAKWTLRFTAIPVDASPHQYRVDLELLKPGTTNRWRGVRWDLSASRQGKQIETHHDARRPGLVLLGSSGELFSEEDLSEIDFAVTLLDWW